MRWHSKNLTGLNHRGYVAEGSCLCYCSSYSSAWGVSFILIFNISHPLSHNASSENVFFSFPAILSPHLARDTPWFLDTIIFSQGFWLLLPVLPHSVTVETGNLATGWHPPGQGPAILGNEAGTSRKYSDLRAAAVFHFTFLERSPLFKYFLWWTKAVRPLCVQKGPSNLYILSMAGAQPCCLV